MAREVYGHQVIADDPTPSPISDRTGTTVLWRQTRTLTLEDGSTAYGCSHCDYVSRNVNSIRPHLGKHNRRPTNRSRTNGHPATGDLSLNTLLEQVATLVAVQADRDDWKARALKAEKALRTLRKALGVP